jgi:Uma2 family endonuclease
MAGAAPSLHYSFSEYAKFEKEARDKHEFVSGLILAMAGGTLEHAALCSAVITALSTQLRGRRCRVFDSNARVRVMASGNAYYPDATVVCGRLEADQEDELSMTNPTVLVEVLSPSTQDYDRVDKLADYQTIASLVHVVHVAHDVKRLDVWQRTAAGWTVESFGEGARAGLPAIDCEIDVSELYRNPLAPD